MTTPDISAIVRGLTKAQRDYLTAVGDCDGEYHARHGVTANWALRHKFTDTVVNFSDGSSAPWDSVEKPFKNSFSIGGQILNPLGLAVRAALAKENGDG